MTLRQRFSKDPLKVVRQLDAFPKVSVECQQSTKVGGTRKQNKFTLKFFNTIKIITNVNK